MSRSVWSVMRAGAEVTGELRLWVFIGGIVSPWFHFEQPPAIFWHRAFRGSMPAPAAQPIAGTTAGL